MPGLATDLYGPIKRLDEKIAHYEAKIFEYRRKLEDAKRERDRIAAAVGLPARVVR